jgi:hypothetical protein
MTYGLPDSFIYGTYKRIRSGRGGSSSGGGIGFPTYDYYFDRITFDQLALDKLLNQEKTGVGYHMNRIAAEIKRRAVKQVGKDTGKLAKSIRWEYERTASGQARRIFADNEIAMIHHEGTRPHVINPNDGKILTFSSKRGATVFTDQVMHPGTAPNRFLSDQLPYINTYLGQLIQR